MQIAESPDSARRVAALYTPNYWTSKYCKWTSKCCKMNSPLRTSDRLIPENQSDFRFTSAQIPYLFRTVQFTDCREADMSRLSDACQMICGSLPS